VYAVFGGMAGVMTVLIIIVIILGTLLFRIKKGSMYTPFNVTYKDTLFLNFRSHVRNLEYCSDSWVTIPCIHPHFDYLFYKSQLICYDVLNKQGFVKYGRLWKGFCVIAILNYFIITLFPCINWLYAD
jgi:hypothetical protein